MSMETIKTEYQSELALVEDAKQLSEFASITTDLARKTIYCLKNAQVISEIGSKGREKIYKQN